MMKQLAIALTLLISTTVAHSQNAVETINLKGKDYTVTKNFPEIILGKYLYEGNGEPIVFLGADGNGLFQPHGIDPIKIKFWIDCDEKGVIRKQEGDNGRHQFTILVQYIDSPNGNYASGKYDLMGVMVLPDLGRAVILGERYKPL